MSTLTYCTIELPTHHEPIPIAGKEEARIAARWLGDLIPYGRIIVRQYLVDWPDRRPELVARLRCGDPLAKVTDLGPVFAVQAEQHKGSPHMALAELKAAGTLPAEALVEHFQ